VKSGQNPPLCDHCSGLLKLNVKLFGEPMSLDFSAAAQFLEDCDLLLIIGTSLSVQPMNSLPDIVRDHSGTIIIANRVSTFYDEFAQLLVHGPLLDFSTALEQRFNPGSGTTIRVV